MKIKKEAKERRGNGWREAQRMQGLQIIEHCNDDSVQHMLLLTFNVRKA